MHDLFFTTAINLAGPGRRETLYGVEYRVVPATLVRPKVLTNNVGRCLLPPDAITDDWARMANGAPVLVDHPTSGGMEISGRSPKVMNALGVGFVFDVSVEDGDLRGEVWLNEARADEVEDLAVILERLDNEETPELSTGFPAFGQRKRGVYNGEEHDFVIYPDGFDHLAVFAEKKGACSVDDGCGLGVANESGEGDDDGDPADARNERGIARRIWAHLQRLVSNELSLDDVRALVRDAAETRWGGTNVFVYVPELFDESAIISVEPQGSEDVLYRVPYTVDEADRSVELGEAVEVERVTEFVPVNNGSGLRVRHEYLTRNPTPEEGDMNRTQLINRLCNCQDVKLKRETLEAMSAEELAFVANQSLEDAGAEGTGEGTEGASAADGERNDDDENEGAEGSGEGEAAPAGAAPAAGQAANASGDEPPAWAKGLVETVQETASRVEALEDATAPAREQAANERKRLVGDIVANTDFEQSELEGRGLPELRKLHRATNRGGASFIGLSGNARDPEPRGQDLGFEVRTTMGAGPGRSIDDAEAN